MYQKEIKEHGKKKVLKYFDQLLTPFPKIQINNKNKLV